MARNDEILKLVLSDEIFISEYKLNPKEFSTVQDAIESEIPIVHAIGMILDAEGHTPEKNLYNIIFSYLNKTV